MRLLGALLLLSFAGSSAAGPLEDCLTLEHHGKSQAAATCFTRLTSDKSSFLRAEGRWGLHQYDAANDEFKLAYREEPQSAIVRTEWGKLFLERFTPQEAAKLFNEALKLDSNYAPAYLGIARVAAEGYSKQAVEFAQKGLSHDPEYTEAHEFLSFLALEDSDEKLAAEEAGKALALSKEALDAMAVMASLDWLGGNNQSDWMRRLLEINPAYGKAYETGAHFLVINRRYQEGIALYRKALQLTPDLWSARSQLGINLMRLGQPQEAKAEMERCYNAHFRDAQTVNALRLLDRAGDYETFTSGNVELVLNKKEAALLRSYVQPELERAIATYSRKYKMQLPGRMRLEVYPNHEDFVVRTLGLPGQGGLLGVTFGLVVAMDSPSARSPGSFNWASTMWHELSHVYVVTATHHLVPRWFTEGLAVHDEGAVSPAWGDRLTPQIIEAIRKNKLLPVVDLERGFIRPDYPAQVLVSYYEAGKMLDFITLRWGDTAVLGMIRSFAARKTTAEAINDNLHETPAAFDKEFMAWLDKQNASPVMRFDEWRASMKAAHAALDAGNSPDAVLKAAASNGVYPGYVGGGSAYEVSADAHLASKDAVSAIKDLEKYRDTGGTNVEALKKASTLEIEHNQPEQARRTLKELSYIYPEDEEMHRQWGNLLLEAKDGTGAVREYRAVLSLQPADLVDAHYRLASALHMTGSNAEAKDEVLTALEDAPRYRPAQKLLLDLSEPVEHP